jgi:hypothetical protein
MQERPTGQAVRLHENAIAQLEVLHLVADLRQISRRFMAEFGVGIDAERRHVRAANAGPHCFHDDVSRPALRLIDFHNARIAFGVQNGSLHFH